MQVINQVTFSCAVEIPAFDPGYGRNFFRFLFISTSAYSTS